MHAPAILILLILATSPACAQSSEPARRDRLRGVTYKLAPGWEWEPGPGNRIAVMRQHPDGDQPLKARLEYHPRAFRQVRIAEIRESLQETAAALATLEVKEQQRMRGYSKAMRVSYRVDLGHPKGLCRMDHWLVRRRGQVYEWIEEVPAGTGNQGLAHMKRGRNGLQFGKVSRRLSRPASREFRKEMLVYSIPIDWDWASVTASPGKASASPDKSRVIMAIRTRVKVGGKLYDAYATLSSRPVPTGSSKKVAEATTAMARSARASYKIIKRIQIDKARLARRSCTRSRFVGLLPEDRKVAWPPELGVAGPSQQSVTRFIFKNGSRLIAWTEYVPSEAREVVMPLIEKARKTFHLY